jgi:hypothetical protein
MERKAINKVGPHSGLEISSIPPTVINGVTSSWKLTLISAADHGKAALKKPPIFAQAEQSGLALPICCPPMSTCPILESLNLYRVAGIFSSNDLVDSYLE